ncbi:MAG: hypothetical protein HQL96_03035 [Magnetococcales bacterium]|nr:hypothetical protein [Magnetococcales bacterium]
MAGRRKRIWCAVSGHGFGHFSQVAPILNQLAQTLPDPEIHVTGGVPQELIARMLVRPFTHDPHNRDVGLLQTDPLVVDRQATAEAVRRLHRDWPEKVAAEARLMAAWSPDLVLADIPYLSLAAARAVGVPSVAIASLTWDEVLAAYLPDHPELGQWLALMRDAYAAATLALLVTPALPVHPFPRSEIIPAITTPGVPHRARMRQVHDIADDRPVILVSLGGIPARTLPVDGLIRDTRFHWLLDVPCPAGYDHVHPLRILPELPFHDLAASVDGIVSKPGYGMAIAATASQVPFVYVRRGVFPDEPPICAWIERHGRAMELDGDAWRRGEFGVALQRLMRLPVKPVPDVRGAMVAAGLCLDRFLS